MTGMVPTTFRTHTLRPLGQDAVTIALPSPHFRRVIIVQRGAITGAFITRSATELTIPGQVQPGDAYQLPVIPTQSRVFVLAPGDALYAGGGTSAGGALASVSVSISQEIPIPLGLAPIHGARTVFRTFTMPVIGINPSITIVPVAKIPRRLIVTSVPVGGGVFLSTSAQELDIPQAVPGEGFNVGGDEIFVVAPGQALYGVRIFAPVAPISISISDIHLTSGSS
ncbi:hypothetical protein LCGC14_2728780 [marine sediment metagenome]|uniref:Uncharacterized protein n=1 Tax=marine sediment metagenome TaxID=412755 RepID=A0A0F9BH13_9ZZZZ